MVWMFYFQKNIHYSFFHFLLTPFLLQGFHFISFFLSWRVCVGVAKRIIMLHTHYAIYLFELFQVEGETGRLSAETTSGELSSDEIATELKRMEI